MRLWGRRRSEPTTTRSGLELDELRAQLDLMETSLREAAAKLVAPEPGRPARTQPSPDHEVRIVDVEAAPSPVRDNGPVEELSEEPGDSPADEAPAIHLLFVPDSEGYELVERPGPPPRAGEIVELESPSGRFAVTRVAPSPLPGDARRCAYLQLV